MLAEPALSEGTSSQARGVVLVVVVWCRDAVGTTMVRRGAPCVCRRARGVACAPPPPPSLSLLSVLLPESALYLSAAHTPSALARPLLRRRRRRRRVAVLMRSSRVCVGVWLCRQSRHDVTTSHTHTHGHDHDATVQPDNFERVVHIQSHHLKLCVVPLLLLLRLACACGGVCVCGCDVAGV